MLRKSAAHQKKVDSAIRVLQTTTGVKVPWAMILAGFLKSDSANKIVHQQVRRHLALMGGARNNQREVVFVNVDNTSSLSDFTCIAAYDVGIVILCPDEPQAEKKADQADCICCPTTACQRPCRKESQV
jgi:hypothetical protein